MQLNDVVVVLDDDEENNITDFEQYIGVLGVVDDIDLDNPQEAYLVTFDELQNDGWWYSEDKLEVIGDVS